MSEKKHKFFITDSGVVLHDMGLEDLLRLALNRRKNIFAELKILELTISIISKRLNLCIDLNKNEIKT